MECQEKCHYAFTGSEDGSKEHSGDNGRGDKKSDGSGENRKVRIGPCSRADFFKLQLDDGRLKVYKQMVMTPRRV